VCAEISAPRSWANPAEASAQGVFGEGVFDVCKSPKV
jgi:hypothetical protein